MQPLACVSVTSVEVSGEQLTTYRDIYKSTSCSPIVDKGNVGDEDEEVTNFSDEVNAIDFGTIDQIDGAASISQSEESESDIDWEDPEDPSDDEETVELDYNNSIRSIAEDETLNDEEYNEDERPSEDENDDEVQQIQVQTSNRMPIQREQRNRVLTIVNIMNSRAEESSSLPIVAVTNFRSLSPKINNVKTDIIEREIGITLCSETWQKDSNNKLKTDIERLLELDGLQFISCPRPSTKRGGGCAVIVNTN